MTFFTADTELHITGRAPIADGVEVGVEHATARNLNAVIDDDELRTDDNYVRLSCFSRPPPI
ncbi:MAG: hypothetical protein M3Q30_05225 [Actinomycetota bacterium]|nr:hypothetical protein [Actinomycetota bacterium]